MQSLQSWLDGQDLHVVAPFVAPDALLPEGRRSVVLLGSDLAALAWAAAQDFGLLLRTTPRADRAGLLNSATGSSVVVSSVDSLHSPILRKELSLGLPGAPWLVWDADGMNPLHPDNAGRLGWVLRHRDACRGGAVLWRHADARLAPLGSEVLSSEVGALRRAASDQPGLLMAVARGIAVGPEALGEELGTGWARPAGPGGSTTSIDTSGDPGSRRIGRSGRSPEVSTPSLATPASCPAGSCFGRLRARPPPT